MAGRLPNTQSAYGLGREGIPFSWNGSFADARETNRAGDGQAVEKRFALFVGVFDR